MPALQTDELSWPAILEGRRLFHITPLHYLPSILGNGALYAKSVLAAKQIAPRASACRRDKMLCLQDYVHFALKPATPILEDKLAKGYPHAVLAFDAAALARLPEHALLRCSTKAWRSRAAYRLVMEDGEKTHLLYRNEKFGELPGMEFLVKYGVGLEWLTNIAFVAWEERQLMIDLCEALSITLPWQATVEPSLAPASYRPATNEAISAYFSDCQKSLRVLPPPRNIPFD